MDHEIDESLIKFDRIANRRIEDAIKEGLFDNLEGAGKPLKDMEDNPFIPKEMRAAYKVLQNSGYAPDWIVLAGQIDADIERLRYNADRHFANLRERMHEVGSNPYAVKRLRVEMDRLKADHRRAAALHASAIEEINRKISTFNNTVPIASLLRLPLSVSDEMRKYEDRVPAYLAY